MKRFDQHYKDHAHWAHQLGLSLSMVPITLSIFFFMMTLKELSIVEFNVPVVGLGSVIVTYLILAIGLRYTFINIKEKNQLLKEEIILRKADWQNPYHQASKKLKKRINTSAILLFVSLIVLVVIFILLKLKMAGFYFLLSLILFEIGLVVVWIIPLFVQVKSLEWSLL